MYDKCHHLAAREERRADNLAAREEYECIRYELVTNTTIQYPEIVPRLPARKDPRAFHIY
jgi:hypothetical protein